MAFIDQPQCSEQLHAGCREARKLRRHVESRLQRFKNRISVKYNLSYDTADPVRLQMSNETSAHARGTALSCGRHPIAILSGAPASVGADDW